MSRIQAPSKLRCIAVFHAGIVLSSTLGAQDLVLGDEHKISETMGGFSGALDPGDGFGQSVAFVDANTLAVGAPNDDDGGTDGGAVWVLTLSNGTVQSHQKITENAGGFGGALDAGDHFGQSVAAFGASHPLGDLDGDGFSELVVGAPGDDDGGSDKGAVWILFMDANGGVASHRKISETSGEGFTGPLDVGDAFGDAVCPVGDIDGDGLIDLAVGASNAGLIPRHGAVWVLLLNVDGTVKSQQKITTGVGGFVGPLSTFDDFGASIAVVDSTFGDLDGDGISDLVVGAPGDDDGSADAGALWVLFLDSTGSVVAEQKVSATAGGFTGPLQPVDGFGRAVAFAGYDSYPLIVVGEPGEDFGATDQGAVWVLALDITGIVVDEWKVFEIANSCTGFDGPLDAQDQFGIATAAISDGSTFVLCVGAHNDDDGGIDQGAAWLVDVSTADLAATAVLYNATINPNPDLLTAGKAIIGASWTVTVTRHPATVPGSFHLIVRPSRIPVPNGTAAPSPVMGRILIAGPSLVAFSGAHNGVTGSLTFPIPCDADLIGLHWACQATLFGGGVKLSSAAEGTVGTF